MPVNRLQYGEMGYEFTVPWKERERTEGEDRVDNDVFYRRSIQVLDDVIPAIARRVFPGAAPEAIEAVEAGAKVASRGIGLNFDSVSKLSKSLPAMEYAKRAKEEVGSVLSYIREVDPNLLNHFGGFGTRGSMLNSAGKVEIDLGQTSTEIFSEHLNKMYGANIPLTEDASLKFSVLHEMMHAEHLHERGVDITGGRQARMEEAVEAASKKAGGHEEAYKFWVNRFYRHMPEEAYADVSAIYHFHKMHGTEVPEKVENIFRFMQEDPTMGGVLSFRGVGDGRPLLDTQNVGMGMPKFASLGEAELRASRTAATGELASALEDTFVGVGKSSLTRRFGRAGLIGGAVLGGAALVHNMFTDDSHDYNKTHAVGAGVLGGVAVEALRTHMRDPSIIEGEWDSLQEVIRSGVQRSGKAWGKAFEAVNLAGGVKGSKVGASVLGALAQAAKSRI